MFVLFLYLLMLYCLAIRRTYTFAKAIDVGAGSNIGHAPSRLRGKLKLYIGFGT